MNEITDIQKIPIADLSAMGILYFDYPMIKVP